MVSAMHQPVTEEQIWDALREVPDPEMPPINLVDLGVLLRVELADDAHRVRVLLMPTFLGCPALHAIQDAIRERLELLGLAVEVELTREQLWSSDRITPEGRETLRAAGIAPPGASSATIRLMEPARCPHCGSSSTSLEAPFGPTPCRAIAYCEHCRQPFEQFKPL